jgi:adenosylmethionine-8-amino-7-oxononanoate aminotransferase
MGDIIALSPSIIIEREHIDTMMSILSEAFGRIG